MYKPIRSAELVSGGNVVKQGEYFTLTYQLFDEDGQVVNIAGNTITVKIANNYGVVFESNANILTSGQISFKVDDDIGYGEMRIELTVTNGTNIVQKYPSDGWIKLDVTPSLDDLGYGGVNTVTVASLKNELTQMQNAYKLVVDAEVGEIEGKATDALAKATSAKSTAETVQGEFDRVVAEAGSNNPEVVQARGSEATLKARLDKTAAQLADTATRRANTVASIGDSITWRNKIKLYQGGSYAVNTGWIHWANVKLGHRLTEYGNFAVSGKRTDEMVIEQLPSVLALIPSPGWCTVLGGANDIIQAKTANDIINSLTLIYDGLASKGIGIIACTITPQTGLTTAQKTILYTVNRWIKNQAETRKDFIIVDWHTFMSGVNGEPLAGVLTDNVHQTVKGAAIMGSVFADAVESFMPSIDVLPMAGDIHNHQHNPFKAEIGSGYLGSVQSANVCYNYRLATADTTTLEATPSIVDRSDGIPGKLQRIIVTLGNARLTNATVIPASPGQKWRAVAELFISPDVAQSATRISLVLAESGGSKVAFELDRDPDVADGEGSPLTRLPEKMILRTPILTTGTGTTGLFVHLRIFGGTNGGYVDVGRQMVELV